MFDRIIKASATFAIGLISTFGYCGVVLAMAIESACVPLPSEIIMPFSGFLAANGRFSLNGVALAGAVGCLLGSYVAYWVGATGGRRFIERYGRYLLITRHELALADRFFARWGSLAILIGRLLPAIRTFIALPAGVAKMKLWPFTLYTLIGSYVWCFALAYAGMKLGQHWLDLEPVFRRFQGLIALLFLLALTIFLVSRIRTLRKEAV